MFLGMDAYSFTILHVTISLIAIAAGLLTLAGMIASRDFKGFSLLFLMMTGATSVTGFLFPIASFSPAQVLGVLSLLILASTIAAKYCFHLHGRWRWTYTAGATAVLYFNCFVAVVQAFQKILPFTSQPVFILAQSLLLAFFVGMGISAERRFWPERG